MAKLLIETLTLIAGSGTILFILMGVFSLCGFETLNEYVVTLGKGAEDVKKKGKIILSIEFFCAAILSGLIVVGGIFYDKSKNPVEYTQVNLSLTPSENISLGEQVIGHVKPIELSNPQDQSEIMSGDELIDSSQTLNPDVN